MLGHVFTALWEVSQSLCVHRLLTTTSYSLGLAPRASVAMSTTSLVCATSRHAPSPTVATPQCWRRMVRSLLLVFCLTIYMAAPQHALGASIHACFSRHLCSLSICDLSALCSIFMSRISGSATVAFIPLFARAAAPSAL